MNKIFQVLITEIKNRMLRPAFWIFTFGLPVVAFLLMLGFVSPILLNELIIRDHVGDTFILFRMAGSMNVPAAITAVAAIFFAARYFSARVLEGEVRIS